MALAVGSLSFGYRRAPTDAQGWRWLLLARRAGEVEALKLPPKQEETVIQSSLGRSTRPPENGFAMPSVQFSRIDSVDEFLSR